MMQSAWWIREIDFRVSTGVIFFLILLLWARGEKKKHLALRMTLSLVMLCATSWCVRFITDAFLTAPALNALGYSVLIAVMCLAFAVCHRLCRRAQASEYIYCMMVAVTVYRLAWNTVKALTAAQGLLSLSFPWTGDSPANSIGSYCIYFAVILISYLPYRQEAKAFEQMRLSVAAGVAVFVISCQMMLEFMYRYFTENEAFSFMPNSADNLAFSLVFYFTALLYCVISYGLLMMRLHVSRLERANADMQDFISNKQQYYRMSREGIASLQTKCHDLKHQIALIRSAAGQRQFDEYVRALEDSINEYNTVIETGNENIDVVLTEKNILCTANGIRFTYIVDGALFSFMPEMDVYALFGNVMDNAIESAMAVADPQRRFISLKAAGRNGMAVLTVENPFQDELQYDGSGLPLTHKRDGERHGFGLRSVRAIAEKHGGMMSILAQDHVFRLTVTMTADGQKR